MEFTKKKTIYLQIADSIVEKILQGELASKDKIESVRELAANIAVNPNTIQRSYAHLVDKEIIFNKRGIGYFVNEDALSKAKAIKKKEFIEEQLPLLFKTMQLLGISLSDLDINYKNYQKNENENQ